MGLKKPIEKLGANDWWSDPCVDHCSTQGNLVSKTMTTDFENSLMVSSSRQLGIMKDMEV